MAYAATPLRPGARYARILAYGLPCPTLGRHPGAGPSLGGDVHDRRWLSVNLFLPIAKTCPHFKPAKLVIKWGQGSAAIHLASLRLSRSRGGLQFG